MKNSILLFSISVLFCCGSSKSPSNLEKSANIKKTIEYMYSPGSNSEMELVYKSVEIFNDFGERESVKVYNKDGSLDNIVVCLYDKRGNLIKDKCTKEDGSLVFEFTKKYNEHNHIIEETHIDPYFEGSTKYTYKITYSPEGKKTEVECSIDGEVFYVEKLSYNSKGEVSEKQIFQADGSLDSRHTYVYDKNGNEIEWIKYDKNNKLSEKTVRKFDEKGNPLQEINSGADGKEIYTYTYIYETFDSYGNWLRHSESYNNEAANIFEREIFY